MKENQTVEFVISGSESHDVLHEVKQDIQGEFCMVSNVSQLGHSK